MNHRDQLKRPNACIILCLLFYILSMGLTGCDLVPDIVKEQYLGRGKIDPSVLKDRMVWEKDQAEMVLIPAGGFQMGDADLYPEADLEIEGQSGEKPPRPVHPVELDAFYMDVHEVTVAQYKTFAAATGRTVRTSGQGIELSRLSPTDRHPIVFVTWYEAEAYAEWTGKRIPTEAEWEYAARGGLKGKQYPWGDNPPDGTQCNFGDRNMFSILEYVGYDPVYQIRNLVTRATNVGDFERNLILGLLDSPNGLQLLLKNGDQFRQSDDDRLRAFYIDDGHDVLAPVGSYLPNGYGLHDMSGNAIEWIADWFQRDYYTVSPIKNPKGPDNGTYKVIRGGTYLHGATEQHVSRRDFRRPDSDISYAISFRCVVDVDRALDNMANVAPPLARD